MFGLIDQVALHFIEEDHKILSVHNDFAMTNLGLVLGPNLN